MSFLSYRVEKALHSGISLPPDAAFPGSGQADYDFFYFLARIADLPTWAAWFSTRLQAMAFVGNGSKTL